MNDFITTDYLFSAYNNYKSFRSKESGNTLLPIDQLTVHIAETLCLNNAEISEWQYKYLLMWSDYPTYPFITTEQFCRYLQVKHIEVLDLYFSLYSYRIDIVQFISFLCIFVFLPTESLLLILLTTNHIYVNRNISDAQINIFLRSIGVESQSLSYVKEWLKYVPREDNTVTVIQLFDFIQSEEGLLESIYQIKKELIIHFISHQGRTRILERKFFYDHQAKLIRNKYKDEKDKIKGKPNKIDIGLPKESCCSNFIRIITGDPSPYYTEYRNITQSQYITTQMLVYEIRCKYGYSQRPYSICGSFGGRSSNNNYFLYNNNKMKRPSNISNLSNNNNKETISQQQRQCQNNGFKLSSNHFRSPQTSNRVLIHSPIGNNRTLLMNSPIMNDNSNRRILHPFVSPKSSERKLSGEFIIGTPVRSSTKPRMQLVYDEEEQNGKNNNDLFHSNAPTPILSPCSVIAQRAIGILDCSKSNASLLANRRSAGSNNSKGSKDSKGSKSSAKVVPIEFCDEIVH